MKKFCSFVNEYREIDRIFLCNNPPKSSLIICFNSIYLGKPVFSPVHKSEKRVIISRRDIEQRSYYGYD